MSLARATLAAALLIAACPAAAQERRPAGLAAAGAWDLALEGTHRRCRITLGAEPAEVGQSLRFPATCRRALPILKDTAGWRSEEGQIRLVDREARAVLRFATAPDDVLLARTDGGETYRLELKDRAFAALPAPALPPIGVPQPTPVDPATAPPFEALPGLYLIDRYTEHEVCRIDLTLAAAGTARFEARLMEGCRDLGLAAFAPVAWRYEAGRLILTARRGHEVTLISERPGRWRRDPEVGATLILRRAAP